MFRLLKRSGTRTPEGPVLGGIPLGERPWLVLGGGGLKGLAHLGAWRALKEASFAPAGIVGSSIGALVGACMSAGRPLEELEEQARTLERTDIARLQRRAMWVGGIRADSILRDSPFRGYLERVLPAGGWEDLKIRFQANAMELSTGREEWFGIGARTDVSLVEAVYASAALPVLYPPARLPGGLYVDGGSSSALPLDRAASLGATGIVAVDAGSGGDMPVEKILEDGMVGVHQRVFSLMSRRRRMELVEGWTGVPLLYVRPELDGYGTFDFDHVEYFLDAGRQAMAEALGADRARATD
ncbi:MAG: patatin-like phospholipase family protein [Gemmatimonadales bacterium]|nr:MAG: patatin-like phospholipase family protein [Gemmatimonadales bacterium]